MKKLLRAAILNKVPSGEAYAKRIVRLFPSIVLILIACSYASSTLLAQSGLFDRIGFIGEHGTHGSMPFEQIDLFTGNVTLSFLDVYLPGPNGIDLKVWRVYNSKILKDRQSGQSASVQAYHQSWVGMGWTMHMGMVHSYSSSNPIIEFPDGRLETAFGDINNSGKYITREFFKYEKGPAPLYIPKLYFSDGVIWTFGATRTIIRADGTSDPVRLVTRIENAHGYHIDIAYGLNNPTIATITDSMGRIVTFVSSGTPKRLTQIKVKINSTTYRTINYSVSTFPNGYTKLGSVTFPLLPTVTFEYEGVSSGYYELTKMKSPYGGYIKYAYSNHNFFFNGILLDSRVLTQKRILFNSGDPEESIWTYTYPDYNGALTGTVQVGGPEYDTDVTYNGYDPTTPWELGTLNTYKRGSGSILETNEWTNQQISTDIWHVLGVNMGTARALLPSTFTRNHVGEAPTKVEYLYERPETSRYGQATKIKYYLNGSSTPIHYDALSYYHEEHQIFLTKYLLDYPSTIAEFSSTGSKLKEVKSWYYAEDNKWGALEKVSKMKTGSQLLNWDYTYLGTDPSIITITVNPPGPAGILTSKFKFGILAEEAYSDYTEWTRTINAYDSSITQEHNNDGQITTALYYDVLGSILRIDLTDPKNDITYNWRPNGENRVVVNQGGNTITHFTDGMGRDVGRTETGDSVTLYYLKTLDSENRVISENKGSVDINSKYAYEYNEADDLIHYSDPTGIALDITYAGNTKSVKDSSNNTTTYEFNHLPKLATKITDALNHSTTYSYDDIGRLIAININGTRMHSYEYDGLDNIINEEHPETGEIIYSYDDSNRLSTKTWGGATINYVYDQYNRIRTIEAGDGASVDETIQYTYENRFHQYDRVYSSKKWSRNQSADDHGNVISETITIPGLAPKTISYSYDSNNNLRRITYPEGDWSEITSNTLNKPEHLVFNSASNILVESATYGPQKQLSGLLITGNNTQYSAAYLANGALNNISVTNGATTLFNDSYTYNSLGEIASISSAAPGSAMNASFGYDALSRVTSASYSAGQVGSYNYVYDEYGNITSARENDIQIFNKEYGTSNRIVGYAYDLRGNLLSDGYNSYIWDRFNRLEYVTNMNGGLVGIYRYDDRGLRLSSFPPLPDIYIESDIYIPDGGEVTFECPVGGPTSEKNINIENKGLASLILSGNPIVVLEGQNADQFSIKQQPTSPVLPGGASTFTVVFEPTSYGPKTAAIKIYNNDPTESQYDITLTGNPYPEINIPQASDGGTYDFGSVMIPDYKEVIFTIQNIGKADLVLSGNPPVTITGDPYHQFVVVQQPNTLIPPGEESTFVVDYVALRVGQSYAHLSIASNDPDESPYDITLMGYGESSASKTEEAALEITSPDGGEEVIAGSVQEITWTGGNKTKYVKIEYSIDNGSNYKTIIERIPNSGFYAWQVPAEISPVCLIRISDADGIAASPKILTFGLNFKTDIPSDPVSAGTHMRIRTSLPDLNTNLSHIAELVIMIDHKGSIEKVSFNGAESELKDMGISALLWHHIQLKLNIDDLSGSLLLDGLMILEKAPLRSAPLEAGIPRIAIFRDSTASAVLWMDDFEFNIKDKTICSDGGELLIKPIVRDPFNPYLSGNIPRQGGWIASIDADNQSSTFGAQTNQITQQTAFQTTQTQQDILAEIDEHEYISPIKALKFNPCVQGSQSIVKGIALPKTIPYDVSLSYFSITSQVSEGQIVDSSPDVLENGHPNGDFSDILKSTGANKKGITNTPTNLAGNVATGAATKVSDTWTGSYYIYSYTGQLLAEYDLLGRCLKEYIYFGNDLIAEYQPISGQYHYYASDNIGSTRAVTDSTGNLVYSTAFNPYGGIQKEWLDDFDPSLEYEGKERDRETELDYYGARYYQHKTYRWISPDPMLALDKYNPQSLNLYVFKMDSPLSLIDILGLWVYEGPWSWEQKRAFEEFVIFLKMFFPGLGAMFGEANNPSDGIVVLLTGLAGPMAVIPYIQATGAGIEARFILFVDPSLLDGKASSQEVNPFNPAYVYLGHEAAHIFNYTIYVEALRWIFNNKLPISEIDSVDITKEEDERRAYAVSADIAGFLGWQGYFIGDKYNIMGEIKYDQKGRPCGATFNNSNFNRWMSTVTGLPWKKRFSTF